MALEPAAPLDRPTESKISRHISVANRVSLLLGSLWVVVCLWTLSVFGSHGGIPIGCRVLTPHPDRGSFMCIRTPSAERLSAL